nr:immunoglobulin light chain junction region [Macaca mulatta]MOX24695.1 immunoglobulin light chain junction region [Macaca mulatta]MOX24849.1 immunoglobulin light chain junction region [Macaca mulatta]MOX25451.1 immunoglobulin light chain junction region [Macaca mulatta]MOX25596.1 immunoglobulin light chain junction region [Macaca mulatta]
CVQDKQLPSTF